MTLDELTTPLTTAEVRAAIYAALAAKGIQTTGWKSGATVRTIIEATSIVLASLSRLQSRIAASGFLELAEGDWLTLTARYVYGVERNEGSFATGEITLTNTAGGVYAGDPGDLVVLNTGSGKTYRNTAAFALPALGSTTVAIAAEEIGAASTASPGEIDAFVTPLLGVTVANVAAVVGTDAELDPALRARAVAKLGTLSPAGPSDAYDYVARSTLNAAGAEIGVSRVRTIADGIGGVAVYVATPTGGVAGTADDPATDLGAIADAIHENVEPLAVTPVVISATPVTIAIEYELWIRNRLGLTDAEIIDAIELRLIDFMAATPIGGHVLPGEPGRVYVSAIRAIIGSAYPTEIIRVDVTTPAADVELAVSEAPVLGAVDATAIHQISGATV